MNTFLNIVQKIKLPAFGQRARLYLIGAVIVLGVGALVFATLRSQTKFTSDYSEYALRAKVHEDAAYLLSAPSNPVRLQLNQVLSDVLGKRMSAEERLKLATRGLELAGETEKQIEAVSKAGEAVDAAVAQMQVTMLDSLTSSQHAKEVIALAKRRSEIISDIRAYSYRADFEVRKIFDRVIADRGELTQSHVIDLNIAIPELEEQFNARTDLYLELERTGEEMQRKFAEGGVLPRY